MRGAGLLLLAAAGGYASGLLSQRDADGPDLRGATTAIVELEGSLRRSGNWLRVDGRALQMRGPEAWEPSITRVRLMLAPTFADSGLGPGARLTVAAQLREVSGPLNPHAFDYGDLLLREGITHQAFVRAEQATVLLAAAPVPRVEAFRDRIAERLRLALPTAKEAGVALALVTGDKAGLDADTREAYTRTGAVHVLAVSGLHTGVVASILLGLLAPLRDPRWRWVKLIALWGGLYAYAALTGFAPSVQRASVMFGVLFAGKLLRLDSNAFNSLGVSAIVLLLIDPQTLFALGFQLSYAAVAGILAFYPPLKRVLRSRYRLLDAAGDLTAVSIAATVATAPLTAYHFHQFPLYFILSGMVAVPLVAAALPCLLGGLALDLAAVALVGAHAYWAYVPGYLLVWASNALLFVLADLPGALIEGLWPSSWASWLAFITVALAGAALVAQRRGTWLYAGTAWVACGVVVLADTYRARQRADLIAYATREHTVVDVVAGGYVVSASLSAPGEQVIAREVQPNRDAGYGRLVAADYAPDGERRFYAARLGGRRVGWLVGEAEDLPPGAPPVDLLIVESPRELDPARVAERFRGAEVVLADRLPRWRRASWESAGSWPVLAEDGARVWLLPAADPR